MLIKKLKLNYFGRFHNKEIELRPGINLIYGENEAGKSTIHTFIKGMLFGIERLRGRGAATKEDLYTRYLPWDYPGAFSGHMDIVVKDKVYRLQRSFHANDKSFTVLDLETGRELALTEGIISELIPGLNESAYKNTISIEQLKAHTDSELASQVRNYITNLSIAKSKEVNVTKAISLLTEKKKAFEASLNSLELKALHTEIEEGLAKEDKMESLTLKLQELMTREQEIKAQREAATALSDQEMEGLIKQLPAILEKYRSYKEYMEQCNSIEIETEELKSKLKEWEREGYKAEKLKEDLKEAAKLSSELPVNQNIRMELIHECESVIRTATRKNYVISLIPVLLATILNYILVRTASIRMAVSTGTLIAGGVLLIILSLNTNKKKKDYNIRLADVSNRITDIENRIYQIFNINNVNTLQELSAKHEELLKSSYTVIHGREQLGRLDSRKEELEDKCDLIQEEIMKYMQHFISEEDLTDGSIQRLINAIDGKKQVFADQLVELDRRYNDNQIMLNKLRWEISALEGNEEQLFKNQEKYAALEQKQKEDSLELEAVKLALTTIQSLSVDIHDSFGKQLNQAVSRVVGEITNHKYSDLKLDEKLEVKVGWRGDFCYLDRLSAGTMDQVYFALRLAVAELLMGKEEMPLILDDSFALYDEKRVMAAIRLIADREQVLMFSCHRREQRILEEMGIPYHYVDMSRE